MCMQLVILEVLNVNNWWIEFLQDHVNEEHGRGVIAPLIFYSDKTTLFSDRKITSHPIYMSISNIVCED